MPYAQRVDALRTLQDLLGIPSVCGTAAEVDIQHLLADRWSAQGWQVDRWTTPIDVTHPQFPGMEVDRSAITGVIARRPGSGGGPTLLFNGHTDVVPAGDLDAWDGDPFIPRVVDGPRGTRIIGRGACDMKAGLLAAWLALDAIGTDPLRGDVLLAPVSAEEDGGAGTFALLQRGVTADMCVIPEPTDLAVIPANAGAVTFRLRVIGQASHASRRTEGVSAIDAFAPVMVALRELEQVRNARVDPLMSTWPIAYPLSIGVIHAGDWASTVPDLLVAEGRYGIALDEDVDVAKAQFESALSQACQADPWLREHPVQVEWWGGQFASGRTALDEPVVHAVQRAHRHVHGTDARMFAAPYGSDLRLMVGLGGIPTVQYGPGESAIAHAPNEYVDLIDVLACARVFESLIREVCS